MSKQIWDYCLAKGLTKAGAAGLMGNLYAESGFNPQNLQNTFEKKLGMTDSQYTQAVDNKTYTNFVHDGAGYGLAQWTYWSRKQGLLDRATKARKSIGDLSLQLEYLFYELVQYKEVYRVLTTTSSVQEASNSVLLNFEKPGSVGPNATAIQREQACQLRASYSQDIYNKYAKQETNNMGENSPLVTYTKISPNRTSPRNHSIDTITIHCVVGQWTAKQICDYFSQSHVQASPNYGVGLDGSIGLCVPESDRSWCSGGKLSVLGNTGKMNDHRAITIETASDLQSPFAVTDAAYNALINLCTDICKRHGKKKLLWFGDAKKTLSYTPKADEMVMTVHCWFANKSCPGDYLYARQGAIAKEVTRRLNEEDDDNMTQEKFNELMKNYLETLASEDPASWEVNALVWAQQNGLLKGDTTGRLMPHSSMTRGELAIVLQRFANKFLK